MNSSPRSDTDPYYECTMGTTMTPTVVSNFHLPNSNVNKNGPYLKTIEQPQTKFRFRYKSEMVGTHGQLKAESSEKNKNIFPTVQLCNWHGGPALIRLTLYTAEDNAIERKRHVHELNGKNCNKEGFTGGCEVVVDEENNFTAQFPNLGITHIAKRDVQNIIFQRKKEELINLTCMKNPGLRTESIQHNIPPIKLQKMKEEADEEAKKMDLNKVVLRFQTFCYDNETNCYRAITEYIDSDVIFNLKNASTGELKIVRISAVSSPCNGKAEIWMLVEKVKKNNVRIKFYELDQDNQEVWKAYGDFKDNDVHHQYAIVFRTPPYRFTNIREPVHVKVQLERTTDNDTSEPLDFTYIPENLKRTNVYLDSKLEYEVNPQKRSRHSDMEAIDLKTTRSNLFLESRDLIKQPYSPEAPHQSPLQMVPSPITPAASPSSLGFYSPPHQVSHNPSITVSNNREDMPYLQQNSEDGMPLHYENSLGQNLFGNMPQMNPQYHIMYGGEHLQNGFAGPQLDECQNNNYYQPNYSNQMLSPYHQVPSPSSTGQSSPLGGHMSPYNQGGVSPGPSGSPVYADQNVNSAASDDAMAQIQQFDAVHKQVVHNKTQVANAHLFDFSDLVKSPINHLNQNEDIDLLGIINSTKLFSASPDMSDIQADFAITQAKNAAKETTTENNKGKDIESLADKLSQVSVSEVKKEKPKNQTSGPGSNPASQTLLSGKELSFRVALTAAGSLQSYAESGDISLLLATHRYFLSVQNNHGENSLHTAILSRNKDAFNKILNAAKDLLCTDIVRAQNYAGETPLHLAVRMGENDMVKRLILTPGCDVNALDADGNSVFHLAARRPQAECLAAVLNQLTSSDKENSVSKIINLYNYHGQTPIHLAVISGCLENVKLLLNNEALIHLCERKQGANSLHLSAMFGRHEIAKYLIENTSITVDAGLLDGNTALHIAVQTKDKKMCAILMSGKANPEAKNNLKKTTEDNRDNESDDEESDNDGEDEHEKDRFTPVDYAEGDEQILSILRGKQECSLPEVNVTCSSQNNNCFKVSLNTEIDVSATI